MIYIFHGDNQKESRTALNQFLESNPKSDILKLDFKQIDLTQITSFLQTQSFLTPQKILAFNNFFSLPKPTQDKIKKIIDTTNECDVVIWQDKTISPTQLKTFPKSQIQNFKLDNKLFTCLNTIKPKNLKNFIPLYHQVIQADLYDLFLYLAKNNIRKQLTGYPKFSPIILKKIYLQLIELDFQNKTGQLAIPKEIALERIFINLLR